MTEAPGTIAEPSGNGTEDQGQVKAKANEVAGQAQDKAQQAAGQAKSKVRDQVDQRSTQAGEQINGAAEDARSVGEELRKQGKDRPAKMADQAADKAEQLGGYLRDADSDRILRDVEDFGRSKPWAVALGGVALGVAASRFLKASSRQRYESSLEHRPPRTAPAPPVASPGLASQATVPAPPAGAGTVPPPITTPVR